MSLILPASSSPDLKAFPLCSKSSKSSEGGQGETVSSTSFQPQTRLTLASALWPQWFLVDVCARAGKTLISRSNLSASGSCRALRACPLWHLWPVSASASQTRKSSPNTIGPHTFARFLLITSLPSSPALRAFLGFIFSFGTDLIRSFFVTYVLKSCRAGCLLIVWFACSGSRLCGQ